jgi:hypothetical protein
MLKSKSKWTPEERAKLKALYADMTAEEVASELGRSVSSVRNQVFLLGLEKSDDFLASAKSGRIGKLLDRGFAHRFHKGFTPWNKGMKGLQIGGTETRFRKGHRPQTWRPVGSERVDKDGITLVKVSDTGVKKDDWRAVHVIAWEMVNGKLPRNKIVIFNDGNRDNFDPSNLIAVTRQELMQRNTVHRFPTELRRVIQLRGALNRQIRKRRQHENDSRPA